MMARMTMDFTTGSNLIGSTDDGTYHCHCCGAKWKARTRKLWWPLSLGWRRRSALHFFDWHGVEVGFDGIEQRVLAQVFHVGPLKIRLGFRASRRDGGGSGT